MASILKVNTIQDATNSNTAISVDTAGRVTTPARPAFSVKTVNGNRFGQDHSDTTYDTNYLTPLPIFTDAHTTTEINVGGGTLSFPAHPIGSGQYLKYVVPVTGTYVLGFSGFFNVHNAGDFVGYGYSVNTASEASAGNFPTHVIGGCVDADASHGLGCSGTCIVSLTASDYVVPYMVSPSDCNGDTAFGMKCFGYLLG